MIRLSWGFILAFTALASVARAEASSITSDNYYVRLGGGEFLSYSNAGVRLDGQPADGATTKFGNEPGVVFEFGYHILPQISVAATFGVPLTTTLTTSGSLTGAGRLGRVTYSPSLLTLVYHLPKIGPAYSYVGAGLSWTIIFDSKGEQPGNLKASDSVGPALTAGFTIPVDEHFGFFLAVAKVWSTTKTQFTLPTGVGHMAGAAHVRLDPLMIYGGLQYRF